MPKCGNELNLGIIGSEWPECTHTRGVLDGGFSGQPSLLGEKDISVPPPLLCTCHITTVPIPEFYILGSAKGERASAHGFFPPWDPLYMAEMGMQ